MKKILLKPPSETYSVDQVVVSWVGCLANGNDSLLGSLLPPAIDHIADRDHIDSSIKALLRQQLIPQWAKRLNAQHGVAYSDSFWSILLMPWMMRVVPMVWRHIATANAILMLEGDYSIERCPKFEGRIKDTAAFYFQVMDKPDVHAWILSHCLKDQIPSHWTVTTAEPICIEDPNPKQPMTINDPRFQRCLLLKGATRWEELLLSIKLSLLSKKKSHAVVRPSVDYTVSDDFVAKLDDILTALLPESLGNNFYYFNSRALKKRYRSGKTRLIGPGLVVYEQQKFYAAHAKRAGDSTNRG